MPIIQIDPDGAQAITWEDAKTMDLEPLNNPNYTFDSNLGFFRLLAADENQSTRIFNNMLRVDFSSINNMSISTKQMSYMETLSNSNNIVISFGYNIANDAYLAIQGLTLGVFAKEEWNNPLVSGMSFGNLDGTPNYKPVEGFVNTASTIIPGANVLSSGSLLLKKLNCAQFISVYKGTSIARASPKARGLMNRTYNNYLAPFYNWLYPTGNFLGFSLSADTD